MGRVAIVGVAGIGIVGISVIGVAILIIPVLIIAIIGITGIIIPGIVITGIVVAIIVIRILIAAIIAIIAGLTVIISGRTGLTGCNICSDQRTNACTGYNRKIIVLALIVAISAIAAMAIIASVATVPTVSIAVTITDTITDLRTQNAAEDRTDKRTGDLTALAVGFAFGMRLIAGLGFSHRDENHHRCGGNKQCAKTCHNRISVPDASSSGVLIKTYANPHEPDMNKKPAPVQEPVSCTIYVAYW